MKTSTIAPALLIITYFLCSCGQNQGRDVYRNGNPKEICSRSNGLRNVRCTSYYENGNIASINHYANDRLQGWCQYFHRNGKLSGEVNFDQGKKTASRITTTHSAGDIKQPRIYTDFSKVQVIRITPMGL